MSYEGEMLEALKMPTRKDVEKALLKALFRNNGVIKEFSSGEHIVMEIADEFGLIEQQRNAYLETVYRKENRVKKSLLWHRLLFRAADSLAKQKIVSRPTQTLKLTNKREWMLTERGLEKALKFFSIPSSEKKFLSTKSYEVEKIVKKLKTKRRPINYDPFDKQKKVRKTTKEITIRTRGFRSVVIEAYEFKCAFCGMKIKSPDSLRWEVEAAHIVPHKLRGKDDIWNGLALCHLHHWAFDVGWFTLLDDYSVQISSKIHLLPSDFGKFGQIDFIRSFVKSNSIILLPGQKNNYPHRNSINWHRKNVFQQ